MLSTAVAVRSHSRTSRYCWISRIRSWRRERSDSLSRVTRMTRKWVSVRRIIHDPFLLAPVSTCHEYPWASGLLRNASKISVTLLSWLSLLAVLLKCLFSSDKVEITTTRLTALYPGWAGTRKKTFTCSHPVRCCFEWGANDLHGPTDFTAMPSSLASLKSRLV